MTGRLVGALLLAGCGVAPLPEPPMVPPDPSQAVVVPYPPPAAKVDLVKPPPAGMQNPIWIDGRWSYRGLRWAWEPGGWYDWAPGDVYAYPLLIRLGDGRLLYYPGKIKRVASAPTEAAKP